MRQQRRRVMACGPAAISAGVPPLIHVLKRLIIASILSFAFVRVRVDSVGTVNLTDVIIDRAHY
jgi:hypothetical protein